jgi:hypothetical protein
MSSAVKAPATTTDVRPPRRAVLMRAMCRGAAKLTPATARLDWVILNGFRPCPSTVVVGEHNRSSY